MSLLSNAEAFRAYLVAFGVPAAEAIEIAALVPRKNTTATYTLAEALEIEPRLKDRFDSDPIVRDIIKKFSLMELTTAKDAKAEKLVHYAERELREFVQIDAFGDTAQGDCVIDPEGRGNALMSGVTHELMVGAPVLRILVSTETTKRDVMMALARILEHVAGDLLAHTHPKFADERIAEIAF